MGIKATLQQLIDSTGSVQMLLGGKRLPPKAAYSVSKLARAVQSEIEHFHTAREKLFTEGGCIVEPVKNEYIHPEGPEKMEAVKAQVEDLLTAEVEINALPLDLEQFGNAELDGAAFFGLDWAMKQA